jgi:hypothetical protein
MRNGKGILHPRAVSLADIAAKENLQRIYSGMPGGHKEPQRAVPVPRASRPQPTRPGRPAKGK